MSSGSAPNPAAVSASATSGDGGQKNWGRSTMIAGGSVDRRPARPGAAATAAATTREETSKGPRPWDFLAGPSVQAPKRDAARFNSPTRAWCRSASFEFCAKKNWRPKPDSQRRERKRPLHIRFITSEKLPPVSNFKPWPCLVKTFRDTVVLSFVCGNYCSTIDQLKVKRFVSSISTKLYN